MWLYDAWDKKRGRTITIKARKKLGSIKSKIQTSVVYETECFGKALVIDNVIMVTEFDEFSYHEMIAHPALHVHPAPESVLVIGGGDGGTIREVLRHNVKRVVLCEIDKSVIDISKKYLPEISAGYSDPRVTVVCEDGAAYVRREKNSFDVILVDSSDPAGPAEVLFREPFYRDMAAALRENGIVITQSESMYYDTETIKKLFEFNRKIFPVLRYYYTMIPTYPSGTIGFSFCSKKYDPIADMKDKGIKGLKYYNGEIHKAAFVLPRFVRDAID